MPAPNHRIRLHTYFILLIVDKWEFKTWYNGILQDHQLAWFATYAPNYTKFGLINVPDERANILQSWSMAGNAAFFRTGNYFKRDVKIDGGSTTFAAAPWTNFGAGWVVGNNDPYFPSENIATSQVSGGAGPTARSVYSLNELEGSSTLEFDMRWEMSASPPAPHYSSAYANIGPAIGAYTAFPGMTYWNLDSESDILLPTHYEILVNTSGVQFGSGIDGIREYFNVKMSAEYLYNYTVKTNLNFPATPNLWQ